MFKAYPKNYGGVEELIDTQWDVNCFTPAEDNVLLMELIDTQWDVNYIKVVFIMFQ